MTDRGGWYITRANLLEGMIPITINMRYNIASVVFAVILSLSIIFFAQTSIILFIVVLLLLSILLICEKSIRNVILMAFFLRLILLVLQQMVILPDSQGDAVSFERNGWILAETWKAHNQTIAIVGADYYSAFIGSIYYLFGRNDIIPQLVNLAVGVYTVYGIYLIANTFWDQKSAKTAGIIASLLPAFCLYSVILLRDTLVVFGAVLSFYFFIKWMKSGGLRKLVLSLIFLALSSLLHGAMILIGLLYVWYFLFYSPKTERFLKWNFLHPVLYLKLTLILIIIVQFKSQLTNKLPSNLMDLFNTEYFTNHLSGYAVDRTAYLTGWTPGSMIEVILQTPVRAAYFLLAPFPWMLRSPIDLIGAIDSLIYLILIWKVIRALKSMKIAKSRYFLPCLIVLVIISITFGWGVANYGSSFRHRLKIVWLLIPLASFNRKSEAPDYLENAKNAAVKLT